MVVMKTFCGCASTRSGTVAIFLLYLASFVGVGVLSGLWLNNSELDSEFGSTWTKLAQECKTSNLAEQWWCDLMQENRPELKYVLIGVIVVAAVFAIVSLIGLIGASRLSPMLMLPWLALDLFAWLLLTACAGYSFATLIGFEKIGDDEATDRIRDDIIALGVTSAINIALLMYLWVCVLSYFQVLRYLEQLDEESDDQHLLKAKPVFDHTVEQDEFFDSEENDKDDTVVESLDDNNNNYDINEESNKDNAAENFENHI